MEWTKQYKKALTFSYDDGVTQDIRLIEILNKYGMKCTFNLNTGLDEEDHFWTCNDAIVRRLVLKDNLDLYKGHEIAVHGLTHPDLVKCSDEELVREIAKDKENIERLFGVCPIGMAYPYGTYDDRVVAEMRRQGIKYSRTVNSTHNFDVQDDLIRFNPTCHHNDEKLFDLAEQFLDMNPDEPQIFYIWGHSYEFDGYKNWDRIEKLCEMLSGRDDIFYGTNAEVLC